MYRNRLHGNFYWAGTVTIVVAMLLSFVPVAWAQGDTFVWGQRFRSGQYWEVNNYMKFPNTSISSGTWIAGPNAIGNREDGPTLTFIESGPWKNCQSGQDCQLRPYGSWRNASGAGGAFRDTSLLLGDNLQYRYYSNYIGSNRWQSVFCDGNGCRQMIAGDLGVDRLPYVISGAESQGGARWGSATTRLATYRPYNSNTVYSWCWSSTFINPSGAGTVSSCNTSDFSWTSNRS